MVVTAGRCSHNLEVRRNLRPQQLQLPEELSPLQELPRWMRDHSFRDWDLEGGIRCLNGCQAAALRLRGSATLLVLGLLRSCHGACSRNAERC